MSTRRFFAYCVLAAWIGLTPVAIKTALDWSDQQIATDIAYNQPSNAPGFDDHVVDTFRIAQIKKTQFLWEADVWVVLTIIGSALLAEPRHHSLTLESHEIKFPKSAVQSEHK